VPEKGGHVAESNNIISFDGSPTAAARINYSVPMPGSHTGRRVVKLDGIQDTYWNPKVIPTTEEIGKAFGVTTSANSTNVDEGLVATFLADRQKALGLKTASTAESIRTLKETGKLLMPTRKWGGSTTETVVDPKLSLKPAIFIVEIYGISSFLGDYGLGRTVKTFTLLPGEATTISMKTWRSRQETVKEASSIIDSHHSEASSRFADTVLQETTDKSTRASNESWHVEAEVSSSWGFGSAKVSGGAAGEYQSAREEFSKSSSNAVTEHANQASSKRETTVTSSSERTEQSGDETLIEREIKNANMRRVLNFVFRELNQSYTTKFHLKDIRIGFTNGMPNSWREVPLSGLSGLLSEVLLPANTEEVAQQILTLIGVVMDHKNEPVRVLETITMAADGQSWNGPEAPKLVNGSYPSPTQLRYYRFKRGPLQQDESSSKVDGVLMKAVTVTMRTDSVLVEALLGETDALDSYAMEVQQAAANSRTLENEKVSVALDSLRSIQDPKERAAAYAAMFNQQSKQ
jgi:hypothetical protein